MRCVSTAILFLIITAAMANAEAPQEMKDNVAQLAEAAGLLKVFIDSDDYNTISSERALEFVNLRTRLDKLVLEIEKAYDEEVLYLAYNLTLNSIAEDDNIQQYYIKEYQGQPDKLYRELGKYIDENEKLIYAFLSSK